MTSRRDPSDCMPTSTSRLVDSELTDDVLTVSRVLVAVAARLLAAHEGEVSLQQYWRRRFTRSARRPRG